MAPNADHIVDNSLLLVRMVSHSMNSPAREPGRATSRKPAGVSSAVSRLFVQQAADDLISEELHAAIVWWITKNSRVPSSL